MSGKGKGGKGGGGCCFSSAESLCISSRQGTRGVECLANTFVLSGTCVIGLCNGQGPPGPSRPRPSLGRGIRHWLAQLFFWVKRANLRGSHRTLEEEQYEKGMDFDLNELDTITGDYHGYEN